MQIVQFDDITPEVRSPRGRDGKVETRVLLTGDETRPDNFALRYSEYLSDVYSPRHHHNFEQLMYILDGEGDWGPGLTLGARGLAYVPEGVFYGPQNPAPHRRLGVQYGGPSGLGYVGQDELSAALAELKQTGVFEKGIYHPNDDVEGKKNQDSYEAMWEHIRKRRIAYPKPQYREPIIIDTDNHPWIALAGAVGVEAKLLGTFSSANTRAALYKLDRGATFTASGRGNFIVLSGKGKVADQPYSEFTTLYLEDDEESEFVADESTEILLLGLPSSKLISTPLLSDAEA